MRNLSVLTNTNILPAVLKITLGVFALFASAQISFDIMPPVPVTLQTLIVMVIGLTYAKKEAVATMMTYLGAGALGVPMFTNMQGGLAKLMGPTGGYLAGFLLAVYTMAYLKEKYNLSNLLNCLAGQILIYVPGILWLSTFVGFEASIYKGFLVYIPSGIVKIIILLSILKVIKKS
jgi:biotin transport system substrate-specific component